MTDLLSAALGHAEDGWPVFPARGKRPLVEDWPNRATREPDALRRLWAEHPQADAIGGACEGVVVVDVDPRNGGAATWGELVREHGPVDTRVHATGGGGEHYIFAARPGAVRAGAGVLGPGVDLKAGRGHMVLLPGSLHPDTGRAYTVSVDRDPAPLPSWVAELAGQTGPGAAAGGRIRAGDRDNHLFRHACRLRYDDVPPGEALERIEAEWRRLEQPARDRYPLAEALRKVERVYATYPPGDDRPGLTDVGNAERLVGLHGDRLRYIHTWGSGLVYEGGRWRHDRSDTVAVELAKDVPALLAEEAAAIGPGSDAYKAVASWAKTSASGARLREAVALARGKGGVLIADHAVLDADPELLNCLNGTVDLGTGKLRSHDPADLLAMQTPVEYDADADAPTWRRALAEWQPDPEVRDYLQLMAGAAATGHPTEAVFIHYGPGGNGKSRFFGALEAVLGPYAVQPHKSLLVATKHNQHDTVKASLFRARLAVASETDAGSRLSEAEVKNLTGGDAIRARRMREDEWSFRPTHTVALFSNHRPRVTGVDEGVWRRIHLVPWEATFPEGQRDPALGQKLAAEAPGVLRWVVEGARRFIAAGLEVPKPDAVRRATEEYRLEEDTVARFFRDEGIAAVPGSEVPALELSEAHRVWCEVNAQEHHPHYQLVTQRLKTELGARSGRSGGKRCWRGIALGGQPSLSAVASSAF